MARKQVTSRDVAKEAGVSRTTVSLVLNDVPDTIISDHTRRRVREVARKLDYKPSAAARALATGKTHRIALVLGEGQKHVLADAFLPAFVSGITAFLRPRGYHLMLQMAEDMSSRKAYADLIRERQVDGIILSGPQRDDRLLAVLAEERIPLVLHGYLPGLTIPVVDVDNQAGARQAVEHLIALGHRRIGFISNAPLSYAGAQERRNGYESALKAHNIPVVAAYAREGNFLPDTGRIAMEHLLRLPDRPTAVFVASDIVAVGAMSAVWAAGLSIPDDVAIVGFDDIPLAAYTHPPLTTVQLKADELGEKAAAVLIRLIEGDTADEPLRLMKTRLQVRASCGAAVKAVAS